MDFSIATAAAVSAGPAYVRLPALHDTPAVNSLPYPGQSTPPSGLVRSLPSTQLPFSALFDSTTQYPQQRQQRQHNQSSTPELAVGMRFESRADLKELLKTFAVRDNWEFTCVKSNATRYTVRCKDPACNWYLHSSRPKSSIAAGTPSKGAPFVISVYRSTHSCVKRHSRNSVASSSWIARRILPHLRVNPEYAPNDIISHMRIEHSISVSYKQAWRARETAILMLQSRAPCDVLYDYVNCYLTNVGNIDPGAHTDLEMEDMAGGGALQRDPKKCNFRRMFLTLGSFMNGFRFCRPVIALGRIDYLREDNVVMLIAAMRDAEDDPFPLAFSVVREECVDSWTWFLAHLRAAIIDHVRSLPQSATVVTQSPNQVSDLLRSITFVSDYQGGTPDAVSAIFPENVCSHALCLHYLYTMLLLRYANSGHIIYADTVLRASGAYMEQEFDATMEEGLPMEERRWITETWPPSIWAESKFPGRRAGVNMAYMPQFIDEWGLLEPGEQNDDASSKDMPQRTRINIQWPDFIVRINARMADIFQIRHARACALLAKHRYLCDLAEQGLRDSIVRLRTGNMWMVERTNMDYIFWVSVGNAAIAVAANGSGPAELSIPGLEVVGMEPVDIFVAHGTSDGVSVGSMTPVIVSSSTTEFLVDLAMRNCSCMHWDRTGIPCDHAIAALQMCDTTCVADYATSGGTGIDGHTAGPTIGGISLQGLVDHAYWVDAYLWTYDVPVFTVSYE